MNCKGREQDNQICKLENNCDEWNLACESWRGFSVTTNASVHYIVEWVPVCVYTIYLSANKVHLLPISFTDLTKNVYVVNANK